MSGRNQHYIPQLLMRGFAVTRGKTERIFLFRPDKGHALPVNMADTNSMKDFYSTPAEKSLDDSITALECNEFGAALHKARSGSVLCAEDEHSLRRFVAHLVVRTASTRTMTDDLMGRTFDAMEATATNPDVYAEFIENSDAMADIVENATQSALTDLMSQGINVPPQLMAAIKGQLSQTLKEKRRDIGHQIAQAMKDTIATTPRPNTDGASIQRQGLAKNLVPPASLAELGAYALSIENVNEDLILGDDPVLPFSISGELQRALLHDDSPTLYCLPIAPRHLLVLRNADALELPSVASLNNVSAISSRQHFIAQSDREEFRALMCKIDTFRSKGERTDFTALLRGT